MTILDGDTSRAGETDRKKIYAGKLAVRSIYEELFRPGKSDKDWLKLIPQMCSQNAEAANLIDDVMIHGEPRGPDEKVFIARLLVQFQEKLSNMDNLTKVGAMAYTEDLYEPYRWFSSEFYLQGFRRDGVCAGISGNLGSGKTNWVLVLMEHALARGFRIVTNVWFDREASRERTGLPMENVHLTKRFTDTLNLLSSSGRYLLVLDEVSQFFDRKTAMAKENIELEHFLRLMRKLRTSAIFIEQDPGRYPTLFEYFMTVYYFKPDRKQLEITVHQPDLKIHRFIDHVPMTNLVWKTGHPASYTVDLNMSKFNELLVNMEDFSMEDIPEMVEELRTHPPTVDSHKSDNREGGEERREVDDVVDQVKAMEPEQIDRLRNQKGSFDPELVMYEFKLSRRESKLVAKVLNRDVGKGVEK